MGAAEKRKNCPASAETRRLPAHARLNQVRGHISQINTAQGASVITRKKIIEGSGFLSLGGPI